MFEEGPFPTIALDSESRVKGICQLMDGLIFEIKIDLYNDSEERLESLFDLAVGELDAFLSLGYDFIARYRERKMMSAREEKRYRKIIEDKYDTVINILKREYLILGTAEVEQ